MGMGKVATSGGRLGKQARSSKNKQTQRIISNIRITLFAAFVTFLVLRGTIGINRLSYSRILVARSHGAGGVAEDIERILREIRSDAADPDGDVAVADAPSSSSSTTRYHHHRDASWATEYSLGPRVTRWNAKRRRWLYQNPGFSARDARGNERVLLVTGSPLGPCDSSVGDHYLLKATKNKIDYGRIHGIEVVHNMARLDPELGGGGGWSKLPLLRRLMLAHPEVEWVWWVDDDAVITDMGFELPLERYVGTNLVVHGHHEFLFGKRSWVAISTGSFLLRNCQWSLELLDAWATMGPRGRIRREAGKLLTATLSDRPAFEADDQSALIHLLLTEKEWWMDKVYVENEYYLHGLWPKLVDKYEEVTAKHHPGFGDKRWPFVTHFVGCKPCGGSRSTSKEDYALDRCLKGMERAFNFADNQVLRLYGFEHPSLASAKVRRVANRTANPLEAKEEALSYLKKPKAPPAPKKKDARKDQKRLAKRESILVRILRRLGGRFKS